MRTWLAAPLAAFRRIRLRHRGRAGGDAQGHHVVRREDVLLARLREVHRQGERRRQGQDPDQLHRRSEGDAAVRGRQRAEERRCRHRQRDGRILHQRVSGGGRLEADRAADGGAAQERRLRLHGQALRREDECRVPGAAHRRQPVPSLPDEADHQAGPDRSQAAHHAGLPRVLPGARRHRGADTAGRGLHGAGARRGRRLRLADHGHLRPRLARAHQVPRRSRASTARR